jgi:hypothetical protein
VQFLTFGPPSSQAQAVGGGAGGGGVSLEFTNMSRLAHVGLKEALDQLLALPRAAAPPVAPQQGA